MAYSHLKIKFEFNLESIQIFDCFSSTKMDITNKQWEQFAALLSKIALIRRKRRKSWEGGRLRRYRRRGKAEGIFVWLQNFRKIAVTYEFHAEIFLAMVQFSCVLILFGLLLK